MITTILILTIMTLFSLVFWRKKSIYRLPPGPRCLPLVGNLLSIGKQPHLKCAEWAVEHGDLVSIHLAHKLALLVNDVNVIRDLFGRMTAMGRNKSDFMAQYSWTRGYGITRLEGAGWLEQRQFMIRNLRKFGFGRSAHLESLCNQYIQSLCEWLEKKQLKDSKVELDEYLRKAIGSVICAMVTGERRADGHQSRISFLGASWMKQVQLVTTSGLLFFPWLRYLNPFHKTFTEFRQICEEIRDCSKSYFRQHSETRRDGEPARDLIDEYIDKVESCRDPKSTFFGDTGWQHCLANVGFLLISGTDLTVGVLHWMMFCLATHPKAQRELQQEIDQVVGHSETPCLANKERMPYMEAVILETLRFATLTPFGGLHRLTEDITFHGYHLPKGMILLPNTFFVHNDKRIWGDPQNFRPERFLEGGRDLKEFVLTFPPGKRYCAGEQLAKDTLFLFAATLFQKYTFSGDFNRVKDDKEYLEPTPGFLLYPKNLSVVLTSRSK